MPHIFISYSQKDRSFAQKIVDALAANNLDTWIDWKSIPKGEDWELEIYRGIEEAEAFLFLISPDSVHSRMCKKEIKHAVKNGKRIIPVVIHDTDLSVIPRAISKLNWFFCRDKQDVFKNAIKQIHQTIQTDYEWLKIHTKLQVDALAWERNNNETSFLLHGKELQNIDSSFIASSGKDPLPTHLQRQFIQASKENEEQLQLGRERLKRNITIGLSLGLVLTIILSLFAWGQRNEAVYQQATAQAASKLAVEQRATAQSEVIVRSTAQAEAENQRNTAISQKLASISSQLIQENPQLAHLLSVEAINTKHTIESKRTILENLNYSPLQIATLYGHNSEIRGLAFSHSGKLLAIGDDSGYITICDLSSDDKAVVFETSITGKIILLQFLQSETQLISGTEDGTIYIWNTKTGSSVIAFQIKSNSSDRFDYLGIINDSILLTVDSDGGLQSIDLFSRNILMQKKISIDKDIVVRTKPTSLESAIILNKVNNFKTASYYLFSPKTGNNLSIPIGIETYYILTALEISNNNKIIATGGCNSGGSSPCIKGLFDLWDAETGNRIIETNTTYTDTITALAFSPDTKILASAGGGSTLLTEKIAILLWSLDSSSGYSLGTQVGFPLYGHHAEIEKIVFSPNGRYLVSGDQDGIVLLWDLQNNNLFMDGNVVNGIKISSDGSIILASGTSSFIHPEQFSTQVYINSKLTGELKEYVCYENDIANCKGALINGEKISNKYSVVSTVLLDNKMPIAIMKFEDKIFAYNLISGEKIDSFQDEINPPSQQTITRIGKSLIIEPKGKTDPEQIKIQIPEEFGDDVSFDLYNNIVYIYDNDKLMALDFKGSIKGTIPSPEINGVTNIRISPEHNLVFTDYYDQKDNEYSLILWDLRTFSLISKLKNQWFPTLSPTSEILATLDMTTNFVNLWDLLGRRIISFETKQTIRVQGLTFSNDGTLLAGSQTNNILIWDISNLEPLGTFAVIGEVDTFAFSDDNKTLVTGGCVKMRLHISSECAKGYMQIWHLDIRSLSDKACELAGRNLTLLEWKNYFGDEFYRITCPQWLPGE